MPTVVPRVVLTMNERILPTSAWYNLLGTRFLLCVSFALRYRPSERQLFLGQYKRQNIVDGKSSNGAKLYI